MRTWNDFKKTIRVEDEIFDCARTGDLGGMRNFLSRSPLVNLKNHKGHSALMLAAYNGHLAAVDFLIENGADPNSADDSGGTILMGVAFKGDVDVARKLIAAGADSLMTNKKGQSALDFAKMFGRAEMVRFLKSQQQKPAIFSLSETLVSWCAFISRGGTNHV